MRAGDHRAPAAAPDVPRDEGCARSPGTGRVRRRARYLGMDDSGRELPVAAAYPAKRPLPLAGHRRGVRLSSEHSPHPTVPRGRITERRRDEPEIGILWREQRPGGEQRFAQQTGRVLKARRLHPGGVWGWQHDQLGLW
jgi:hypothetical protein